MSSYKRLRRKGPSSGEASRPVSHDTVPFAPGAATKLPLPASFTIASLICHDRRLLAKILPTISLRTAQLLGRLSLTEICEKERKKCGKEDKRERRPRSVLAVDKALLLTLLAWLQLLSHCRIRPRTIRHRVSVLLEQEASLVSYNLSSRSLETPASQYRSKRRV